MDKTDIIPVKIWTSIRLLWYADKRKAVPFMLFYEITLLSAPKIVFAWRVDTENHRNFYDHKPDFLEISLCEEGRVLAEHPDGSCRIHCPGMLGLVTSDMAARTSAYHGERQRHTTAAVRVKYDITKHDSRDCDIGLLQVRVKKEGIALLPIGEYLEESFGEILNILNKIVVLNGAGEPLQAVGQWYRLLAAITEFTLRKLTAAALDIPPAEVAYASKAEKYMDKNYMLQLSVEDIAEHLGISTGYLHRIFKNVKGCGVLEYVNRKRVEIAIGLVENRNLSLKEAARNVGIEDPSYMSRLFKKVTGISFRDYFREKRIPKYY